MNFSDDFLLYSLIFIWKYLIANYCTFRQCFTRNFQEEQRSENDNCVEDDKRGLIGKRQMKCDERKRSTFSIIIQLKTNKQKRSYEICNATLLFYKASF